MSGKKKTSRQDRSLNKEVDPAHCKAAVLYTNSEQDKFYGQCPNETENKTGLCEAHTYRAKKDPPLIFARGKIAPGRFDFTEDDLAEVYFALTENHRDILIRYRNFWEEKINMLQEQIRNEKKAHEDVLNEIERIDKAIAKKEDETFQLKEMTESEKGLREEEARRLDVERERLRREMDELKAQLAQEKAKKQSTEKRLEVCYGAVNEMNFGAILLEKTMAQKAAELGLNPNIGDEVKVRLEGIEEERRKRAEIMSLRIREVAARLSSKSAEGRVHVLIRVKCSKNDGREEKKGELSFSDEKITFNDITISGTDENAITIFCDNEKRSCEADPHIRPKQTISLVDFQTALRFIDAREEAVVAGGFKLTSNTLQEYIDERNTYPDAKLSLATIQAAKDMVLGLDPKQYRELINNVLQKMGGKQSGFEGQLQEHQRLMKAAKRSLERWFDDAPEDANFNDIRIVRGYIVEFLRRAMKVAIEAKDRDIMYQIDSALKVVTAGFDERWHLYLNSLVDTAPKDEELRLQIRKIQFYERQEIESMIGLSARNIDLLTTSELGFFQFQTELTIPPAITIFAIGPSGGGKTTLGKMLLHNILWKYRSSLKTMAGNSTIKIQFSEVYLDTEQDKIVTCTLPHVNESLRTDLQKSTGYRTPCQTLDPKTLCKKTRPKPKRASREVEPLEQEECQEMFSTVEGVTKLILDVMKADANADTYRKTRSTPSNPDGSSRSFKITQIQFFEISEIGAEKVRFTVNVVDTPGFEQYSDATLNKFFPTGLTELFPASKQYIDKNAAVWKKETEQEGNFIRASLFHVIRSIYNFRARNFTLSEPNIVGWLNNFKLLEEKTLVLLVACLKGDIEDADIAATQWYMDQIRAFAGQDR